MKRSHSIWSQQLLFWRRKTLSHYRSDALQGLPIFPRHCPRFSMILGNTRSHTIKNNGATHDIHIATLSKSTMIIMWAKEWMQNHTGVIFPRIGYLNITREEFDLGQAASALQPQGTYFSPVKSPTSTASLTTHATRTSRKVL